MSEEDELQTYRDAIECFQNIKKYKALLEEAESCFESMSKKLMPAVWKKYGNGIKWEKEEDYHVTCPYCQAAMIEEMKKVIR